MSRLNWFNLVIVQQGFITASLLVRAGRPPWGGHLERILARSGPYAEVVLASLMCRLPVVFVYMQVCKSTLCEYNDPSLYGVTLVSLR